MDIDDSRLGPGSFLDADPPRHDELRKILHADFAPASLGRLEPLIAAKVDTLVGSLLERGEVDLVGEFARRLPVSVVCDLLGATRPSQVCEPRVGSALPGTISGWSPTSELQARGAPVPRRG